MSNVACSNAVFSECEFLGTFKDIDFGASGFWDCTFRGTVQDIWIRGDYSSEMLRSVITRQDLADCGDEVDEAFSLLAEVAVNTRSS